MGVVDGIGGAVELAGLQAVGLEVDGDDAARAHAPQHKIEPEAGGPLADDGDVLADDVGQLLAGVDHGAELLGLQQVLRRNAGRQGQDAVCAHEAVLGHAGVVGDEGQGQLARRRIVRRVMGDDLAEDLVAGGAGREGVVLGVEVMQPLDIAAAEGEQARADEGVAGAEFGQRNFDEFSAAGRHDLDGAHGCGKIGAGLGRHGRPFAGV